MRTILYLILCTISLFVISESYATNLNKKDIYYYIITGNPDFTYYSIGKDLSKYITPYTNIDLSPIPSEGSVENIRALRYRKGVKFAIVQHDVYQEYLNYAEDGDEEAYSLINELRVIMPLYFEEVHILAHKDTNIKYIHEIRDKKINIGPKDSGTAMTAMTIYKKMFNENIPRHLRFDYNYEDALRKLADGAIDVVFMVGGQPIQKLKSFKDDADSLVQLLELDSNNSIMNDVLDIYYKENIKAKNYSWLKKDVKTIAVKAYLITYNFKKFDKKYIEQFAESLGQHFSNLKNNGHQKWNQV